MISPNIMEAFYCHYEMFEPSSVFVDFKGLFFHKNPPAKKEKGKES